MATSLPLLDIRKDGNALIIGFVRADMTDASVITQIGDEIYHLVKEIEKPRLVVDFSQVERLSSATLGMLVALRKVVTKMDGQLRIANVADDLIEIFKITRLDVTLRLCKSTEAAVESFEQ
jgi:anti-sigma B factor antagonist